MANILAAFVVDGDGNVVTWSAGAEQMFGFPAHEVVGRGFWLLCEHDEAVRCVEALTNALAQGGAAEARTFRRKDGSSFGGVLLFTPAGAHVVAAIASDEGVAQESSVWQTAALAHDLRQPITAIQTAAFVMTQRLGFSEWMRPLLDRLTEAGALLADMIEDLLDASSARLGAELALHREEVDLGELLGGLVDQLRLISGDREIILTVEESLIGRWDRRRLWRILQNLTENAVAHSEADSAVRIICHRGADGVVCRVENRSAPIAPEALPGLFEPFRRGSGRGRSGLGLHIARELARAHGGDVTAWSHDDTVAFTLFLPLAAPAGIGAPSKPRRHPRIPFEGPIEVRVGERTFAVEGRDISRRGLGFYSDTELAPREQIRIAMPSRAGSLSVIGTVRHVVPEGGRSRVGVEFLLDLLPTDVERLLKQRTPSA